MGSTSIIDVFTLPLHIAALPLGRCCEHSLNHETQDEEIICYSISHTSIYICNPRVTSYSSIRYTRHYPYILRQLYNLLSVDNETL